MPLQKSIKIVVVGDGTVGKTCMLMSFVDGRIPEEYVPTVFDNHTVSQNVGQEVVAMNLWDTAGQEAYDRLRTISYTDCHLFLICFSIVSPVSYENIQEKWHPEVTHFSKAPVMLVGTKSDLRDDQETLDALGARKKEPITYAQGMAMAKRLGAEAYMECSAVTQEGLKELFGEAARIALDGANGKKRGADEQAGGKKPWERCCLL